jgi:hypothetical protein
MLLTSAGQGRVEGDRKREEGKDGANEKKTIEKKGRKMKD